MKRNAEHEWWFATEPLGAREKPVTERQLANFLQVTTRTLCNWRNEGKIPYWRIGGRIVRYQLSAVEAALGKPEVVND